MRVNWRWIIGIFFLLKVDSLQRIPGNKRVYRKKRDLNINEDNKYMEKLKEYDLKAQEYIINMGSFMYDKSREYFEKEFTEETVLEKWSAEYETQKVMEEKKKLEQKIRDLRDELEKGRINFREEIEKVREDERQKNEKTLEYFRKQVEAGQKDKEIIFKSIDTLVNEKVEHEKKYLTLKIKELEERCDEYYKRYEKQNKGKYYETDLLMPAFEKYNEEQLDNRWDITHVGDIAKKTDFIFKDKHTKKMIMIDSKNNNERRVGTGDMEKFRRDIFHDLSFAVGGIMVANGKIGTKKNYEICEEAGKVMIFISNFNLENIGMIFSQLDIIIDLTEKKSNSSLDNEVLKRNIKEWYKNEVIILNMLERQKKQIDRNLMVYATNFNKMFNEDILLSIKDDEGDKIIISNEDGKDKWCEENIQLEESEELMEGRIKKGKKSNYPLFFESEGKKYVQYFKTETSRKAKITQLYNLSNLQKKVTNLVDNVIIENDNECIEINTEN